MIEKMRYINITGPRTELDRVAEDYLSRYEIHLENALTELSDVPQLSPFTETNPYKEAVASAARLLSELPEEIPETEPVPGMDLFSARTLVAECDEQIQAFTQEKDALKKRHDELLKPLRIIRPFKDIRYDLQEILHFRHIVCRLGRIDRQYHQKLTEYIYDSPDTILIDAETVDQYVYCLWFAPAHLAKKVGAIYSSMHFEPIESSSLEEEALEGSIADICEKLEQEHREIHRKQDELQEKRDAFLREKAPALHTAQRLLSDASDTFDIRRMAASTDQENEEVPFFIISGWMTEDSAAAFEEAIKDDESIFFMSGEEKNNPGRTPPTKLKNPPLLKPFEMYIRMYGLPSYTEMDPTWFLAVTYSFIFGAMFGDVGQGLLLFLGGFILYRKKHVDLAGIISCAGIFSILFGFLYGSLFGFEDILPALWLHPMTAMMAVPFVGRLNTVFVAAIAFGMFLILVCMVFNILNARKAGDTEKTWFDHNAVAGLVFYGSIVLSAFLIVSGHKAPGGILIVLMFVLPLVVMFLKEPLTHLVEKKAKIMPEQKGIFFVQSFFEMFEVLLSYLSNTLSFLRIGAFAVSHAAMMEVVMMLSGAENGGSPNWIVIVLGNLFVCGMEGLIVGIQVLRLEYYEIFSRFYKGSGREFRPFKRSRNSAG